MGRLFGTDGVRGVANAELTPELALGVAVAAAGVLVEHVHGSGRPVAVVGRDPRASGEFLEAAVVAGLASTGVDVVRIGVVPTPAVAYLTGRLGAQLGVMLSASHNPMPDNGIKLFDADGYKLPDPVEDEIERRFGQPTQRPTGPAVGRVLDDAEAVEHYRQHLLDTLPAPLAGLRVVVDCANGAATSVSPDVLRRAGADVHVIGAEPDGVNINHLVGSTHPEQVIEAVRQHGADVGIAHDGDADRCIAVAADGTVVDGDEILAICALARHASGRLPGPAVATTVMTNLGFRIAMRSAGIEVVETAVGDRYVLEAMRANGLTLGGEQSGHLVFLDHATTGDGVLTALQLLSEVSRTGTPLRELASVMTRVPQVLENVPVADKAGAMASPRLAEAIMAAERDLGDAGRVLVRPSGTEPVVRVMVEATTEEQAVGTAKRLTTVLAGL